MVTAQVIIHPGRCFISLAVLFCEDVGAVWRGDTF